MENRIYSKIFMWLFVGLLISFVFGYCLSLNEILYSKIIAIGIIPIIIAEIVIAVLMGIRITKMSPITAKICYILYSAMTGVTFGSIFLTYKMSSIIFIFLVTSVLFALLGIYGYITKKDVFKIGRILFIGLIGVIIVSIINIFIGSTTIELGLSILSILIFMGYIIYDVNNIKLLVQSLDEDKAAVYGAFQLYLDFINLFIRLLELFGKKDD